MKHALFNGLEVLAGPDALDTALCPSCGDPVELKRFRVTWYYRHAAGMGRHCPLRRRASKVKQDPLPPPKPPIDPYLYLASETVIEAVDLARQGYVPGILSLAFSPFVHATWEIADVDPEHALDTILRDVPTRTGAVIFRAILVHGLSPKTGQAFSPKLGHALSPKVVHSFSPKLGHKHIGVTPPSRAYFSSQSNTRRRIECLETGRKPWIFERCCVV